MANLEATEATQPAGGLIRAADLVIGIPSSTDGEALRKRALQVVGSLSEIAPSLRVVVAYPAAGQGDLGEAPVTEADSSVRFVEYTLPLGSPVGTLWLGLSESLGALRDIAERAGATSCAVLAADLAILDSNSLRMLVQPVLDQRADLVMPIYRASKYEGLLNSAILYPMTRALYGKRIRYPLAIDFGISTRLLGDASQRSARAVQAAAGESIIWLATDAATSEMAITQAYLNGRHPAQNDSLDLSTVLSYLIGSLFGDVEKQAAAWQRVRGSQITAVIGSPAAPDGEDKPVDIRPMLESFYLGSRNLQEIWSLVLPPVTLLELKRLARVTAEQFRIPDGLWARIIYDFALAYRLRTISRAHLLGALTPLYLGWVASYVQEISSLSTFAAEQRIEQLAKAYEDGKPYFVSRWRWPDRFNP